MIKYFLNFISLLIVFLSFNNVVLAEENVDLANYLGSTGAVTTYSDETVDLGSHFGSSGATYTDGNYYYGFDRNFTDNLITNQFHVISGYESPTPPNEVVYISSSYFQFSNFGSQCGNSNFSFSDFVEIDYSAYNFIDKITSVYYNDTPCAITSRTDNRLYFTCTAPYTSNSQLYIYYATIPSYPTYSAPVSIGRIVGVSCPSQNQTIIDQNNQIITNGTETNEKLDDINDTLTDDNVSGIENSFQQFEGFLEENSTITQLITLPITLYSSILNNVGGTCQPFNLGALYGENLVLPCVNIGNYLGSTLWSMIDLIISGFSVYFISKKLIKVFNNFSSMKDGDVIDD